MNEEGFSKYNDNAQVQGRILTPSSNFPRPERDCAESQSQQCKKFKTYRNSMTARCLHLSAAGLRDTAALRGQGHHSKYLFQTKVCINQLN